jgi:hypothetical protein
MARDIKRTDNYTAFLANTVGQGRVHPSDVARGKHAIVPKSMRFKGDAPQDNRLPAGRSIVSEAGVFDPSMRGSMK